MNDPGLDEPIGQESSRIEKGRKGEEDFEKEEEQAFLKPSRWWFASTGFPLIAATLGPMASAFNLCALIVHWRVEIPPGVGANESHGNDVRDPKWLLAINGISLGFVLIANFALLLNMARRISFAIAQPITIVGWYISAFLLLGDISGIVHMVKKAGLRRALTQAYYYAIFACSLYFFIATLMVVTVYGAWKHHYKSEFKLTMSQRTLMLQTISFMIYMLGGAGVYAKVEGWMFLDSLFFVDYTLLTVGIGDIAPATHLGRGLLFPYAVGGIVIIGLVIGSIRSLVLERGKNKLANRMTEKKRRAMVEKLRNDESQKIIPIKGQDDGMNERQRREAEFNLMRRVQTSTETRQKWIALLFSGGAWLVLWFLGALVFYYAEHEQSWSYFGSLYFAYTSLLTVGYGDFVPFSNSGKAFFVIWSLLAVPALTIVISNMGDTVVKAVKDATLYVGEFTFLPGEINAKNRLKQAAAKIKNQHTSPFFENEPTGISDKHNMKESNEHVNELADTAAEQIDEEATQLDERGFTGSTVHERHYLLAREFRRVMKHLNESPPRTYTYKEWVWFLKLMGEDEGSADTHRQPDPEPEHDQDGGIDLQQGKAQDDRAGERGKWSWLGERSPLMGETPEAEWVLDRLAGTLEDCLKELHTVEKERSKRG